MKILSWTLGLVLTLSFTDVVSAADTFDYSAIICAHVVDRDLKSRPNHGSLTVPMGQWITEDFTLEKRKIAELAVRYQAVYENIYKQSTGETTRLREEVEKELCPNQILLDFDFSSRTYICMPNREYDRREMLNKELRSLKTDLALFSESQTDQQNKSVIQSQVRAKEHAIKALMSRYTFQIPLHKNQKLSAFRTVQQKIDAARKDIEDQAQEYIDKLRQSCQPLANYSVDAALYRSSEIQTDCPDKIVTAHGSGDRMVDQKPAVWVTANEAQAELDLFDQKHQKEKAGYDRYNKNIVLSKRASSATAKGLFEREANRDLALFQAYQKLLPEEERLWAKVANLKKKRPTKYWELRLNFLGDRITGYYLNELNEVQQVTRAYTVKLNTDCSIADAEVRGEDLRGICSRGKIKNDDCDRYYPKAPQPSTRKGSRPAI